MQERICAYIHHPKGIVVLRTHDINPDQNTRNKMALLMERKYTKAMTENADCVKGVYSIRKFIQKISANAIQKAVDRLVNNANEGI